MYGSSLTIDTRKAARLEDRAERSGRDPLAQRGNDAASDEYESGHRGIPPYVLSAAPLRNRELTTGRQPNKYARAASNNAALAVQLQAAAPCAARGRAPPALRSAPPIPDREQAAARIDQRHRGAPPRRQRTLPAARA